MSDSALRHRVHRSLLNRLARLVPFGVCSCKPRHFRDMLGVLWDNRDNLPYAYKIITRGVCDGCALGVAGLRDWTISGPHLCMTRLNLLRLNTAPALKPELLESTAALEKMDNQQLRLLGRLAHPYLREKSAPRFVRISWKEAVERIATKIRASDPRRIAFFVTARGVTNEVYYMAQKAARFLGTNNVDNAARICHAPSTAAMKRTLGVAASTCSYRDWYGTDLLVFFGSNPANDQPVATKYIHEAKRLGTKVVMVNPYREPGMDRYWVPSTASSALFGTDIMDYWFPVAQGGDIAFLCGVARILFENGWENREFLNRHTTGVDELRRACAAMDWQSLEQGCGLPRSSMFEFARLLAHAKNAVFVWSMGITQHAFGADGVQMILNIGLLRGYIGRERNGLMPIRGHSSVQGGGEMGCYSTVFPGLQPINQENAAALAQHYGFEVPAWTGLTTPEMVEAAGRGEIDLLYSVGGNLLRNLPATAHVRQCLENLPVRVHQDVILNDQMFVPAREDVILLPAKTRYEQDDGGHETSTERRVMFSPQIPRQVGEARAEWKILREIAAATHPEKAHLLGCATGWEMREEIARVVPFYDGIQHFRKTGDAFQYGGSRLCENGCFPLPGGKARMAVVPLPDPSRPDGCFKASTRRGKQFNSLVYAEVDPINGAPRDAVLMHPDDAASLGLAHGDRVEVYNDLGAIPGRIWLSQIAAGNLQLHWPEGNAIIRKGVVDGASGAPDYNAFVRVRRV